MAIEALVTRENCIGCFKLYRLETFSNELALAHRRKRNPYSSVPHAYNKDGVGLESISGGWSPHAALRP